MARKRFFVDAIRQGLVTLGGDEARHLRQVLRAEPRQRYELCDGTRVVLAEIISFRKGDVTFQVLEEIPQVAPLLDLTLYAALIKLDRYEWIVEKATELGVARIVPLVTERTDFGLEKAVPGKLERWRRIALEASKQSHRMAPPRIEEAMGLGAALGEVDGLRLILDENETKPMLDALPGATERNQGDRVALVTGPEGGWTDAERTQAREAGFLSVSLGPVLLRAETAAVAGIAVLLAVWGVEGAGLTRLSSRSV
ncbi:MAG: 16S rRNA (uracil(1498)-N(3))-methyltransferase [Bryobacterales bacterium]|nr:16S rRNA (uracil(1498)-N(3))-methyltransferase [Bryobacterales bacterium]